ncbi:glycosyltransferase [Chryseolinea sp. T2]|uniref:glycosyltransferase n=1 Tax=Chryseolinea sp. T2 TaxID=3129255 RepID=UPI0030772076
MQLIFLAHPEYLGNKSMIRFARLLAEGMARRGHQVETWTPKSKLAKLSTHPFIQKWLSYVDHYILFSGELKRRVRRQPADTLFVLTDQSLGLWVKPIASRAHVIHCHDFLALKSALGEIPENPINWSGRKYQTMIRKGFSRGKYFISVSLKTKEELDELVLQQPEISEVVYNGLHQKFAQLDTRTARTSFGKEAGIDLTRGYILHVGGNAWYKNRLGVIMIYDAWRRMTANPLPLLLVGAELTTELQSRVDKSQYRPDIYCLTNINDDQIILAYAGASLFLFPSLGEGFGWPIAEAMASGTIVITTGEAPMSEVAGDAAYLIPRQPLEATASERWAEKSAVIVEEVVTLSPQARSEAISRGIVNARRFETEGSLDRIEAIYKRVVRIPVK